MRCTHTILLSQLAAAQPVAVAQFQRRKLGKRVLVIEQGKRVGGVSVHTGTIPSKTLRETALNLSGWRERGFYGRAYRVKQEISADDLQATPADHP